MAIYLDAADLSDARAAVELGFCEGFTTNPALLARHAPPPLTRFAELLEVFGSGPGFYQPSSAVPDAAEREARAAVALAPRRVVVKLPARTGQFTLARRLSSEGITCAMTAVYAPAQALVAAAAGAAWVIPYADRARRLDPAGEGLVASLSAVVAPMGGGLRILAASLKDPGQVARAVADGAHDVTVPLAVLARLGDHPVSDRAILEFEEAAGAAQVPASPAG
ncbi:MAG: transaldolase family protein [Actinomycetota bacterium]